MNNWVNLDDVRYALENLSQVPLVIRRAFMSPTKRVQANWATMDGKPSSFGMIPAVNERMQERMSGDPAKDHYAFFLENYLQQRSGLTGLSVGCGEADGLIRWAQSGHFKRLIGIDVSTGAIETGKKKVADAGFSEIIDLRAEDVFDASFEANQFDCVFCDQCLHHFSPLETIVCSIKEWMKSDGLLLAFEFVGPNRFQWTDRQLEAAQALLALIPKEYRIQKTNGKVKRRVHRPSRLRMQIGDPSEAVESENVLGLLDRHFRFLEKRDCGGTLLHPLLHNIAHHFADDGDAPSAVIDMIMAAEDMLLECGEISSDFVVTVHAAS